MRFDKKEFEVRYAPSPAAIDRMLAAIRKLGFRPSVDGPVRVALEDMALRVAAASGLPVYEAGDRGSLAVQLAPGTGWRLGGKGLAPTRLLSAAAAPLSVPRPEITISEAVTGRRSVSIPVRIAAGAKPGWYEVSVTVRYQGDRAAGRNDPREVTLRVPVRVR